jgi:antitoxin component YwqK of YwqJK toxin-antitoxin module
MQLPSWSWPGMLPALVAGILVASIAAAQEPMPIVQAAEPVALSPVDPAATAIEPAAETAVGAAPTETSADPAPAAELVTEKYPSGALKIEREMVQDAEGNYLLHGAWRYFDEQGHLVLDGHFERDLKTGLWRRFYQGHETKLLTAAPYKDFAPPFISEATFRAGKLHGNWTITDSQQRKVHEIALVAGERHAAATWYHPSGAVLLHANYDRGIPSGNLTRFAPDGSIAQQENYQNGRKLAPKVEYHDQARQFKKHDIAHLHAALVLKTPDNWDTGTLATFESQGHDERHGPFSIWHANGQLARQGEYHRDQPVGKLAAWFASGQKQLEGQYVDGRQEGIWTWWHENGQKAATGEFRGGVAVGNWAWWSTAGKIAQRSDLSPDRARIDAAPEVASEIRQARVPTIELGLPLR